jgi:hypothetical protein
MPIIDDIRKALETHVSGAVGVPSIAYENAKFDKTAASEYVECSTVITSRRPSARGPNPLMRYQGLFQMTICVAVDEGTGDVSRYADILLSRFDGSTDITATSQAVSIEYSEPGDPYDRDPFYCYPVQVAWYAYGS